MKITFSPSRLFVSKEILGIEALITKIKNLVDFAMIAVREAQPGGDRPSHCRAGRPRCLRPTRRTGHAGCPCPFPCGESSS